MLSCLFLRPSVIATTKIAPSICVAPVIIFLMYADDPDNQYEYSDASQFHIRHGTL